MADTAAIIVAAGRGERVGGDIPKQYRPLAGKPVLRWAAEAFAGQADPMVFVIDEDHEAHYESALAGYFGARLQFLVPGGATRQESVRAGLEELALGAPEEFYAEGRVLIHDAARPFASRELIAAVVSALDDADAAAPLLPVSDTLRRKGKDGYEPVSRDELYRAQTPQGFRFEKILTAHRRFAGEALTDDLALAERAGLKIAAVKGEEANIKLTTPDDFVLAERIAQSRLGDVRTGTGFDTHRFGAGDHLWLCGVKIPHRSSLVGHSDADVGLHALTDAILGALGAADIGAHFPPSDEKWRGAPSGRFLEHAALLVKQRNGVIAHVDVTLICEAPKIAPHRETMRARIAEILKIELARVSVKATTSDGLGFTGRREGIAAQAVATIRLPS
jgi:2-C-methyl-D-erythritol 4-phosphate cytidylyltransferase / 2-C-methyl-D-erythritol 2,4-cyclodiphosphate synthase